MLRAHSAAAMARSQQLVLRLRRELLPGGK
jgi:hypothetical protein